MRTGSISMAPLLLIFLVVFLLPAGAGSKEKTTAADRDVALQLALVPDLRLLAALEAQSTRDLQATQAEIVAAYERLHLPYRVGEPLRRAPRCATGEHTVAALSYRFVIPSSNSWTPIATLVLSERQLHDTLVHDRPVPAEARDFVRRLPPLTTAKERDHALIGRLLTVRSRAERTELLLDLAAEWGDEHHATVRIAGLELNEPRYDTMGYAGVRWRPSTRAFDFRENMTRLLRGNILARTELETYLPLLLQHEDGLAGVSEARFVGVFGRLGNVELEYLEKQRSRSAARPRDNPLQPQ